MNKQTLGWIFFGIGVFVSLIPPVAAIFYIVAIVFFAKSRKETGGLVGLILSILFLIGALLFSLLFLPFVIVGVLGGIPAQGGSAYYDSADLDYQVNDAYWDVNADIGVDPVFSASANNIITLRNNLDTPIEVTNLVFTSDRGSTGQLIYDAVPIGVDSEIELVSDDDFDSMDIFKMGICLTPGDFYEVGVEVTYSRTVAGMESSFTFSPSQKIIGTCAN